jgi:putative ABC transport system substrate-binding protein
MASYIARRKFLATLLGGAAPWPVGARAQQRATPVIGFLSSLTASNAPHILTAFRKGLNEAGYVEGQNIAIEYRWAEGQYDRLQGLAAEIVRRKVAVIAAVSGTPAGLAAKAATATIPIVFAMGSDPIAVGLVSSLSRPSGNITGATFFTGPLGTKRLGLLRELVPKATTIALLTNPNNAAATDVETADVRRAADAFGQKVIVFNAGSEGKFEGAFADIVQQRIGALFVSADPFFFTQRNKLISLAARHAIPAIYADREDAEEGGLISYGASRTDAYRQAGNYAGRILKGDKPSDLPILLPTKFELLINLKTARALGLAIPPGVLAIADEVIE